MKYEASLPSWTVVLAQYTGYYRPWQRKALRLISYVASVITVSIGFYDLYKHFPLFSFWLNEYMSEWASWLEQMIMLRMTFLISYIIYYSEPLQQWGNIFFAAAEYTQIERLFFPVYYLFRCIKGTLIILYELSLPVTALICFLLSSGWNLIWSFLTLPYLCLTMITSFFTESTMALVLMF